MFHNLKNKANLKEIIPSLGNLYHSYDGLWYDPAGMRTHDLFHERRKHYPLSQTDTVVEIKTLMFSLSKGVSLSILSSWSLVPLKVKIAEQTLKYLFQFSLSRLSSSFVQRPVLRWIVAPVSNENRQLSYTYCLQHLSTCFSYLNVKEELNDI